MHRIDNPSVALTFPAPEPVGTPGYFQPGDVTLGIDATIVDYDWMNTIQEEACNLVANAGLTLDKSDNTQWLQAIIAIIDREVAIDFGNYVLKAGDTMSGNLIIEIDSANPSTVDHWNVNRHWQIGVDSPGQFFISDETAGLSRMTIATDGGVIFSQNISAVGLYANNGSLNVIMPSNALAVSNYQNTVRQWQTGIDTSGDYFISDQTAGLARLTISATDGGVVVTQNLAAQGGLYANAGSVNVHIATAAPAVTNYSNGVPSSWQTGIDNGGQFYISDQTAGASRLTIGTDGGFNIAQNCSAQNFYAQTNLHANGAVLPNFALDPGFYLARDAVTWAPEIRRALQWTHGWGDTWDEASGQRAWGGIDPNNAPATRDMMWLNSSGTLYTIGGVQPGLKIVAASDAVEPYRAGLQDVRGIEAVALTRHGGRHAALRRETLPGSIPADLTPDDWKDDGSVFFLDRDWLLFAYINAFREVAARLDALEARAIA